MTFSNVPGHGIPYHQLARNEAHRWWRPVVGTGGILCAFFSVGFIALSLETVLYGISEGTFTGLDLDAPGPTPIFGNAVLDELFSAALAVLVLLAMLLAVFAVAKETQKRPPGTLSSVTARVRWRWLAVCLALAAAFCAVLVGAALLVDIAVDGSAIADTMNAEVTTSGWGQAAELLQLILWIVLAEYIFRGWILQAVGACTLETARGRPSSSAPRSSRSRSTMAAGGTSTSSCSPSLRVGWRCEPEASRPLSPCQWCIWSAWA
jgi:hypothetical protein